MKSHLTSKLGGNVPREALRWKAAATLSPVTLEGHQSPPKLAGVPNTSANLALRIPDDFLFGRGPRCHLRLGTNRHNTKTVESFLTNLLKSFYQNQKSPWSINNIHPEVSYRVAARQVLNLARLPERNYSQVICVWACERQITSLLEAILFLSHLVTAIARGHLNPLNIAYILS